MFKKNNIKKVIKNIHYGRIILRIKSIIITISPLELIVMLLLVILMIGLIVR